MKTIPALVIFLVLITLSGCAREPADPGALQSPDSPFASFREIPGVTEDEIREIEALQGENDTFVYGMSLTNEAFIDHIDEAQIKGYSVLFCEWLTKLFDIEFKTELYEWGELFTGLENGAIDFTGDFSITDERLKIYHMTGAIAERTSKSYRLQGAAPLSQIAQIRPPRFVFLENSAMFAPIAEALDYDFEVTFIEDYAAAYDMLKTGEADVFVARSTLEASFDEYEDVTSEVFFPLIYQSTSLTAQNDKYKPVISVVQKALLHDGTRRYLADLYGDGYDAYRRHKLFMQLTDEERDYIASNPVVNFIAEIDNYPISFYNTYETMWQGIAHEVLREVEDFTGLTFQIVNNKDEGWPVLFNMLENGEAAIVSELVRTDDREGRFLWTETAIMEDRIVLLSKTDHPHIDVTDITNLRVGTQRNTVFGESFRRWFPDHDNLFEYDNIDDILEALDRGEVDMMMGRTNQYLASINYRELFGYKINFVFNSDIETVFGFNKNERILSSIVDKALKLIDSESIVLNWTHRVYDYRYKVIEARTPWLVGAAALLLFVIALLYIMSSRSRSEEKRLGRLVKEKTSTLTAILDATPDLIFCQDLDSRTIECNKAFEQYFNTTKADILGKNDMDAFGWTSDKMAWHVNSNKKVTGEKITVVVEEFLPATDGKQELFETIKTPMTQDGKVTGFVGMSRNITQRKAMEEEVKNASEAKSRFIANMSHEMRTPMNVVVGLTDLMLEDDEPVNTRENLKKINTAGNTLMGLINDVLDISKIEAGKLELTPAKHDVPSNINDVVTLNLIRIEDKPVTFNLDISENLPCTLYGDELRIKQIMNNLLSNAFKYTHKGTVTLGIDSRREGDDMWMLFYVSDTGIGIKEEDMAKLFTEYNQVDTRANRRIEGTGLGLSITKKLVELMDGDISVESEYGKGTTFRVRIRVGLVDDAVIGREVVENLRGFRYSDGRKREKLVRSDLSYARVLLVDDFPTNLDVAAGMLRKYKIQVDCVDNGQAAVDRIEMGKPVYDTVFMDHMMPGMDGVEATTLIRAIGTKYARTVPIVALTANAVAGNEQMFLSKGFNAYLPKPINVMNLDSIVQRWVRDKSKE